jgi:high-affinity iron transporter
VSALLIILREGVEAALLIMLLLGMARRNEDGGGAAKDVRAVHVGWLGAALLGVITWFASGLIVRMGGGSRELMEGIVSLIAAAALLAAGHFVLARADAQRRVEAMKRRLADATSGARRRWALAGLAFLAIFREAFEVVLFLRTVAIDPSNPPGAILLGVAAGVVLLVVTVFLLRRLGRHVKPGPLLAAMGTLLCVLAVILAGKGIHALQAADVLPLTGLSAPAVEWLGFYPSLQGLAAQLAVLAAFVGIAAFAALRSRAQRTAV